MMVLLANGQRTIACDICHGESIPAEACVAITPEIHVCDGCKAYQTMGISFFGWYRQLERLYQAQGQATVPRDGRYADDWPIRYFEQGFAPEHALETMERTFARAA